jgi:hypothetical protein
MVVAYVVTGPRFAKSYLLFHSVAYREILIFFLSFYTVMMETVSSGNQTLVMALSGIG